MSDKIREGWAHLSESARDDLVERRYGPEGASPEELSEYALSEYSVRIKATTLSRRLREWKNELEDAIPEYAEEEEITSEEVNANVMEVTSAGSRRIRSADALIEEVGMDMDEWMLADEPEIKAYEAYRRNEDKNLHFDEGRITGHVKDKGKVTIVTLWSVKCKFVRKQPVVLDPEVEIQRYEIAPTLKRTARRGGSVKRALIVPDPHFGFERDLKTNQMVNYHDRRVLDLALQVAENFEPDHIIFNGDLLDLAEWSDKFARSPEMKQTTQPALIEAGWWLRRFRMASPSAHLTVMEGNHDERMQRVLQSTAQQMYQLQRVDNLELPPVVSMPYLLALDTMDAEWLGNYPNEKKWLTDTFFVGHGNTTSSKPGYTSGKIVDDSIYTMVTGHIHRFERATKTIHLRDGQRVVRSVSLGCVARVDGVVPAGKEENNWQQGFGIAYYTEDGELEHIEDIEVENGRMIFNGEVWEARSETVEQMEEETPWRFL